MMTRLTSAIYRPVGVNEGEGWAAALVSTPWILLKASFLRGATTHVSGIVIALTRGERLERKRASLLKRVRRALVFVLLILTHVAGAWLCVVF